MNLNIHNCPGKVLMNYFLRVMGSLRGDVILSLSASDNCLLHYCY